jgi:hypothetical protein
MLYLAIPSETHACQDIPQAPFLNVIFLASSLAFCNKWFLQGHAIVSSELKRSLRGSS